ncbi:MAG: transporter substrate-binding domain-containing protein [Clostridia bacterium]|nr:transporter substrate-binding domain-containing protein [Clostridia bacterium]
MKKILVAVLLVLVVCLASISLVACNNNASDAEYIQNKGTLICGITLYEPMNYADADGEMTGFDTEFAQAVCQKLGIEAKFQVIKWSSKETELNSKYIDCIWNGFTVTDERKENIKFTKSYLSNKQCVVTKLANVDSYTDAASCQGKKAAAEQGSAGETSAKDLTTETLVTSVGSQMSALTELKSGNVDFAVVDIVLANQIVGAGDFADLRIVNAIDLEGEEYAIGFRKGSDMAEKVNAIIDVLIADGTLQTIAEKYGLQNQLIK